MLVLWAPINGASVIWLAGTFWFIPGPVRALANRLGKKKALRRLLVPAGTSLTHTWGQTRVRMPPSSDLQTALQEIWMCLGLGWDGLRQGAGNKTRLLYCLPGSGSK